MPNTYDSVRQAVEVTLAASFTALPIAYDNMPAPAGAFVRAICEPGLSTIALTGGGDINLNIGDTHVMRHSGAVVFEINIPLNTGTKLANDVAETLTQLFANKRINEVTFKGGEAVRTGEFEAHYQLSLFVYYYRDSRP